MKLATVHAVDRQRIERPAHGIHRRLVGGFFIAAPGQARTIERRRFGNSHRFQS